jgi:hypothetical protein
MYIGNEHPLIEFFQSEQFARIQYNIYFVEMFEEELSHWDARRYFIESVRKAVKERYHQRNNYCSLRVNKILEIYKNNTFWWPEIKFWKRNLLKNRDIKTRGDKWR